MGLRRIFEDRFIREEEVYRAYMTDERMNIDQKDSQTLLFSMSVIWGIKRSILPAPKVIRVSIFSFSR